ncbi:MAG: helix-turn-helix transcriptional regulator [Alphaproteobacteria bacterium]|nr:helix-turn-helix transcriptional regulator [Alphaproteobacteria bacterium]
MAGDVVVAILPSRREVPKDPLTTRERDVVALIAEGHTNDRIAKRLGISASTVRTHIERLLEKLHARSRAEAVTRAIATGQLRRA